MTKSVLDTPELLEIEKKVAENVYKEAETTLNTMADFYSFFAPWEQALTEAFGKRDETGLTGWDIVKLERKTKCLDQ